jgi:hypothetical protein
MPRVDISQILGFYTSGTDAVYSGSLLVSGSMTIKQTGNNPDGLVISGSTNASGSITIIGYDTFGDKSSPDRIDLGTF